jgi:hypothetical protein
MSSTKRSTKHIEFDHIEFCVAGTPHGHEVLGAVEDATCVRCGARIVNVFVADGQPYGGDCLATLTGEPGFRRAVRTALRKAEQMAGWLKADRGHRLVGVKQRVDNITGGKAVVSLVLQPQRGWSDYEGRYMDPVTTRYVAAVAPSLGPVVAACVADALELPVVA